MENAELEFLVNQLLSAYYEVSQSNYNAAQKLSILELFDDFIKE